MSAATPNRDWYTEERLESDGPASTVIDDLLAELDFGDGPEAMAFDRWMDVELTKLIALHLRPTTPARPASSSRRG
jgi:hypothetical protein